MKTKSQIFTEAHKIARTLEGDYTARLSEGLRQAWNNREVKQGATLFVSVIEKRTAKAILVSVDMGTRISKFWLPLSQVTLEHDSNLDVNITMPYWLANNLVKDNKVLRPFFA